MFTSTNIVSMPYGALSCPLPHFPAACQYLLLITDFYILILSIVHKNVINTVRLTMTATLSRSETWSLLGLTTTCLGIIVNALQADGAPLVVSLAFSGLAYSATYTLIRWLGPTFIKANLKGRDLCKSQKKEMYRVAASIISLTPFANINDQSRDHGCRRSFNISPDCHSLHPFRILQGHCRRNFWRWQP